MIKATTDAQKQEIKTALIYATKPGSVKPLGGKSGKGDERFGGQPSHDLRASFAVVTHSGHAVTVLVYDDKMNLIWSKPTWAGMNQNRTVTSINQMVFTLIDTK